MLQKAVDHVTKALLEESRSEDKHVTRLLQHFNKAYNSIAEKIRCKETK